MVELRASQKGNVNEHCYTNDEGIPGTLWLDAAIWALRFCAKSKIAQRPSPKSYATW